MLKTLSRVSGRPFHLARSDLHTPVVLHILTRTTFSGQRLFKSTSRICLGCGAPVTKDPSKAGYLKDIKGEPRILTARDSRKAREAEVFSSVLAELDDALLCELTTVKPASRAQLSESQSSKAVLCSRCHSLTHHSCVPDAINEEKAATFDIYSAIRRDPDALVVNMIDVMDFPLSLLDLRKHIGSRPRIIHVFNRLDILFKKPIKALESRQSLTYMLADHVTGDEKVDVRAVSALKGWEVETLANSLRTRRKGTNIYFVGSANAGKSSLISSLGKRASTPTIQLPTTSHLPGTTLASIPTEIELFGELLGGGRGTVVDLPGVLKPGFSTFIKPEMLQQSLPHKHIRAAPLSLRQGESLILGDLIRIDHVRGDEKHILITPYMQLKPHCTSRPEYILSKPSEIRVERVPEMQMALEESFAVEEKGGNNVIDLVFKDVGFVSIAIWKGRSTIRVYSPGGLHVGLRKPAVISNSYDKV